MMLISEVIDDAILLIRISREEKRNAIDADLTWEIDRELNRLDDDLNLRVGIITGTPTVFSAGTDMYDPRSKRTERGGEYGAIRRFRSTPLIAAVEGPALGGGFELALSCDMIVAAADATFGLPEPRRGLVATSGGLFRAPLALPLNIAREMLLTGRTFDAQRCYDVGVVNALCEPGGAVDAAVLLAREILTCGPLAVTRTLEAIQELVPIHDERSWETLERVRGEILDSDGAAEGRRAFAEKRAPRWQTS